MLIFRNLKKRNIFLIQQQKDISSKPRRFSRNYTISNDDIEKQYRIVKHALNIFPVNESKDLMSFEKSSVYHQKIFYEIKNLSRIEAVYNEEEKKQILKRFQKVSLEQLKDEKRKIRENKINKLENYAKKFEIEGKMEHASEIRVRISELKQEEELEMNEEGNKNLGISENKDQTILDDKDILVDSNEQTLSEKFKPLEEEFENKELIEKLERRVQKDINNEEQLKDLVENDRELAKELEEIEDLVTLFDKDDPLRKMENLDFSDNASYKNIVERKKEFDIRFESFFRKENGESVNFPKENEYFEEMDDFGNDIEEDIEKNKRAQGYVKLLHQKQILEECVKTVKDSNYQEFVDTHIFSEDKYRIDCGLVLQRAPIFVKVNEEDMAFLKTRRDFFKKYYYDFDKLSNELDQFNDHTVDFWDNVKNDVKNNIDNAINIKRFNKEKNKMEFYSLYSKNWRLVDPDVKNNKSIQYNGLNRVYVLFKNKNTGKWEFPTISLKWGDTFGQKKELLQYILSRDQFKVHFPSQHPFIQLTRGFYKNETSCSKFMEYNGVRTYYFDAFHFRGELKLHVNDQHDYIDYVFASKGEMNKYLDENYYNAIIGSLFEY